MRLAHSYPDGAPLVAITGQVGCTAGYDHSPFPVSSLPQSRLAFQGNKKRRVPIHILYFFICSLSFLFLNKYYFCRYSAINFPKSSPEHYTVTPSSSGRSGWSAGRSPFGASWSAGSFSAASQTINHIEDPNLLATKIIVPHKLIPRESCCPPEERH